MATFTAHRATTNAKAARTSRQGSGDEAKNREVGQNTILEKTHEFFKMCDIENKGFISRRDMQRLNAELPLSAEELENVFDTLDSDGNGFLTLDEFSSGFSKFLSGQKISVEEGMGEKNTCKSPTEVLYQTQWEESLARPDEDEEEKHFGMLMESLGANSVFEE
ncbi:EF-hand calcium-binding domain-containing protein 4B-like [Notothenia coriiceps]|uniref:EF-hand calcium-binding domain-containing protein 4B-like n=1 Tax=Notothenia coriiceps TaxID=8208 RepID=A0A6I9PCI1_9TELE|nr:PREDICTED: EF-hand calcium-binding domain-containing protein 4B-like [Notothenia coriiceps]